MNLINCNICTREGSILIAKLTAIFLKIFHFLLFANTSWPTWNANEIYFLFWGIVKCASCWATVKSSVSSFLNAPRPHDVQMTSRLKVFHSPFEASRFVIERIWVLKLHDLVSLYVIYVCRSQHSLADRYVTTPSLLSSPILGRSQPCAWKTTPNNVLSFNNIPLHNL